MVEAVEGAHIFILLDGCHATSSENVEEKGWKRVGWEVLQVVCGKGVTDRSVTVIRNKTLQNLIPCETVDARNSHSFVRTRVYQQAWQWGTLSAMDIFIIQYKLLEQYL